ncbi:MAG: GH92 family glycosyl hydrolase [Candidatus Amulumruptor sp.]|nr:GH92 family glycosyl hydrolase [Candidatus Amulumruptor sp.]
MANHNILISVLAALSVTAFTSCIPGDDAPREKVSGYVEPRIGTAHCRWFHFAPGAMPFGLAKPGPSTNGHKGNKWGWEATGYDYRDGVIDGFPNLHEFQVGGITLMPTVGEIKTVPGDSIADGYRSHFSHDRETARPGYYSVVLDDYDVTAEVTATERVAFQRYTFPKSDSSHVIFDIGNRAGESGAVRTARVTISDGGSVVSGSVVTVPEYVIKYQPGAEVPLYFYAEMSAKPASFSTFNGDTIHAGADTATGPGAGAVLNYTTAAGEQITAKIGLSYTSVEGARRNLEAEARDLDFAGALARSEARWEDMLSRITVEGASDTDKTKFYTGLYHAILGRGLASDVDGAYPRHDGGVGQIPLGADGKPVHNLYNTDAMWGAMWNLTQLWALAYPEFLSDFTSSHLLVYGDCGWLGDGLANSRYVSGVGTNMLSAMIAAAYQCGIRDFDIEKGYEAALKNEIDGVDRPFGAGKVDTGEFVKYGYVPHIDEGEGHGETYAFSASHTLEASYTAWAVAQLADAMGKTDDRDKLLWLSKGWERLFDPSTGFVRPRYADGTFIDDFDPMSVWRGFQEGNAWQYTFYVPHDAKALINKVGRDTFVERLDSIFTISRDNIFSGGKEINAFAGLQTVYNHGNQPCLHTSWLFSEADRPSLTRKWTRLILDEFYGSDGIHGYGYGQDEDQGQLGAWYVMSSIGLFDIGGLTAQEPSFAIGSPKFDRITIRLNRDYYSGDKFVITTAGNSPDNVNIVSATLNGKPFDGRRIPFRTIAEGGELDLTMTSEPNDAF